MVAIVKQPLALLAVMVYVPVPAAHRRVPVPVPEKAAAPVETSVKLVLFALASMIQPVVEAVQAPHVIV